MDATAQMTMWRNAIAKEQGATRAHEQRWGFLYGSSNNNKKAAFASSCPTKYYHNGEGSVVHKRLPMLPLDKLAAASVHAPDVEQLITTRNFTGSRPMTALDSTLHSHAKSLHTIRTVDPFFKCTSTVYGSRLPLEQFGVSHHGHADTVITRWERQRDME